MLLGITGLAQHGKDTIGERLVVCWGFKRQSFADGVKDLAYATNPLIPNGGTGRTLQSIVDQHGWDAAKTLFPPVRTYLQNLGQTCREMFGEDIWIRKVEREWLEGYAPLTVITDVRYPNEAEWIRRQNGKVVRVERLPYFDNGVGITHASESSVLEVRWDAFIANDGTIEDLWAKTDELAERLLHT